MKNIEKKKVKKKLNKKFMIPLLTVFALGLVLAIGYYALFSVSFTVQPSITLSEGCNDALGTVYDGDIIVGSKCVLTNDAPSERSLVINNNAIPEIEVSYLGTLDLSNKDSAWNLTGTPITIGYTIIGDTFEVTDVPEGYTAIYYKDTVVGLEERIANPQPAISIVGAGNLPHLNDANIDELANYCEAPDNYNQCKGAKIWVVPNGDLVGSTLNWANMANYYYELDLIQYNAEGEIMLSSGASLTITPVYEIGVGVVGEQVIETTVA